MSVVTVEFRFAEMTEIAIIGNESSLHVSFVQSHASVCALMNEVYNNSRYSYSMRCK